MKKVLLFSLSILFFASLTFAQDFDSYGRPSDVWDTKSWSDSYAGQSYEKGWDSPYRDFDGDGIANKYDNVYDSIKDPGWADWDNDGIPNNSDIFDNQYHLN